MAVIEAEGRQYLEGNFGPVAEERTVTELAVTGAIPSDISGRYLRIGPNPWPIPDGPYHWFNGAGMVHGVELRDGGAQWYRNRWVRTGEQATRLGEEPRPGPAPAMYDASNTNVLGHAGRILALTEGSMPYVLDAQLETVCRTDFSGGAGGVGAFTAHPKIDPVTGELLGFRYWFDEPFAEYFAIGADGVLTRKVAVDTTASVMMHDFSVTEKYAVFYDLPVTFRIDLALDPNVPFPFAWDDEYPARLGLLSREDGNDAVRWFDIDPCYVFHPMNAYDDGDSVVLDVVRYDDMFRREETKAALTENGQALDRWTIDLAADKVHQDTLDDREQEFPQVDPRVVGRRHRIGYTMSAAHEDGMLSDGILKHDLATGATTRFDAGPGRSPGEASFVPAGAGEDDGYLVTFVYDAAADRSDLVVLDASSMDQVAAVHLPTRVPYGFHGSWIAD